MPARARMRVSTRASRRTCSSPRAQPMTRALQEPAPRAVPAARGGRRRGAQAARANSGAGLLKRSPGRVPIAWRSERQVDQPRRARPRFEAGAGAARHRASSPQGLGRRSGRGCSRGLFLRWCPAVARYGELGADEVNAKLTGLSQIALATSSYERSHKNRAGVLKAAEREHSLTVSSRS